MSAFRYAALTVLLAAAAANVAAEDVSELVTGSGLLLETSPSGASVYINGLLVGQTPYDEAGLAPGLYRITVRAVGYYDRDLTVTVSSTQRLKLSLELEKITGFLRLTVFPLNAMVSVDGETAAPGLLELAEGFHALSVKAFGYEAREVTAAVNRFLPADLEIRLEEAALSLKELSASRSAFNPGNSSRLGETTVFFIVSKPSIGTATVVGPDGAEVLTRDLGQFSKWNQTFSWNGRNEGGAAVPDGAYIVRLTASDGSGRVSASIGVRVDSGAYIGPLDIASGLAGLMFSPTAAVQPKGTSIISISALSPLPVSVPFAAGLAFSLVPVEGLAIGFGFGLPVGIAGEGASILGGAAYAAGMKKVPISVGGAVSGSLSSGKEANGRLTLLATAGLGTRPIAAVIAPGFEIGYTEGQATVSAAIRSAAYVETGGFLAGISCAVRSTPLGTIFGLNFPVQAAAEAAWLIPGTSFAPGVVLEATWNGYASRPDFRGGLSFQVLF
jgi:hypothetical protein